MEFPVDDVDRARQLAHELWPHAAHEIGLGPALGLLVRNVRVRRPGTVFTDVLVHIRYHLTYEAIEVYPLQIIVGMTLDGHIRRVLRDFDTLSVANTRPTVAGPDADMIAVDRSELPYAEMHHRKLIVYATGEPDEPPRLAWMIKIVGRGHATGHEVGDDTVIIDAHNGDILAHHARGSCFAFSDVQIRIPLRDDLASALRTIKASKAPPISRRVRSGSRGVDRQPLDLRDPAAPEAGRPLAHHPRLLVLEPADPSERHQAVSPRVRGWAAVNDAVDGGVLCGLRRWLTVCPQDILDGDLAA